jgi:hypothetical protein
MALQGDVFWRDALCVSALLQVLPMGVGVPFRLNGSEDCVRGHAEHGPPGDVFGGTRSACPPEPKHPTLHI